MSPRISAPGGRRPSPFSHVLTSAMVLALIGALALSGATAGRAATATLTDGRAGAPSALRDLSADGPRDTRWGSQPNPYQGNLSDHEGRSAGSFEDGSRGRVSGEILADENGRATIVVRDLKDTKAEGKLVVTTGGEATRIAVERGANGNTRTISLTGLVAGAWNSFKVLWAMGSAAAHKRDGFSVCRT